MEIPAGLVPTGGSEVRLAREDGHSSLISVLKGLLTSKAAPVRVWLSPGVRVEILMLSPLHLLAFGRSEVGRGQQPGSAAGLYPGCAKCTAPV